MGKISVTLHRWRLDMPDTRIDVEPIGGRAPDEIEYDGATYRKLPGNPNRPMYLLDRLPRKGAQ